MPKHRWGPRSRRAALAVALAWALAVGLAACTTSVVEVRQPDDRPVVLTTFTVLADMAQVVAGPDARVESLTGPGTEIHGYEPSPDDLRRASEADLLLANGLGLEAWLQRLVAPLDLPTVLLTDRVDPVEIEEGASERYPLNPHAWMSPRVGRQYVAAIAEALADLDPARAAAYHQRAQDYSAEIQEVETLLVERLADVPPEHRLLVTCEGAFSYLARDTGLTEAYLWPVNAERQGTPQQVAAVIRAVREADVPAVFCESTVSPLAQAQVARETGAVLGGVLYVDSLSEPEGPVPSYLDLLRHDAEVILAGLSGASS